MDKLMEILQKLLCRVTDDLDYVYGLDGKKDIAQAHAQILELMGMSELELKAILRTTKDNNKNRGWDIFINYQNGRISKGFLCQELAHALHTAWEERIK